MIIFLQPQQTKKNVGATSDSLEVLLSVIQDIVVMCPTNDSKASLYST